MSDLDSLLSQASLWTVVGSPAAPAAPSTPSASPSSSLARRGGFGGGGDDSARSGGRFVRGGGLLLKSYSVISVEGSNPTICFGSVGIGSASFCVRKNCGVKAHVDTKTKLWDSQDNTRVFIVRGTGGTVFAEPSIGLSQVPSEVWTSWQSQQLTLTEWKREFCAVEITNDSSATIDEVKEETSFLIRAKDFRTPSKRFRESVSVSTDLHQLMDASDNKFVKHTRLLPVVRETGEDEYNTSSEISQQLDEVANDGRLSRVVSKVESSVVAVGEALEVLAEQTHNRFVETDHEAKLIAGAIHTLSSSVGAAVELDDRFEAPTLWGTAAFIADEMIKLSKDILSLELGVSPLKAEMDWMRSTIDGVKTIEEASSKMSKIIVLVMQRLQSISPELDEVRSRLGMVEAGVASCVRKEGHKRAKVGHEFGKSEGSDDPTMDDLLRMLNGNSIARPDPGIPFSQRSVIRSSESEGSCEEEEDSGGLSGKLLKHLFSEVALLKACAQDESVKFGGLGLRSIQDCQEWIHQNFSCHRYGLMMDPLLMLDRICGDERSGGKRNQFKTWESRIKLKITTGAEEAALQAIAYKRPFLFHTGKTAMVSERNKSKLDQMPSFATWKSGGEGVRNYIVKQMNVNYNTMSQEISFALGRSPEFSKANALAVRCLNDTITFLTQLMNFVDTIYEKLVSESQFTVAQAWSLTTQILDRICEELYVPKEGVSGAMLIDEPESVCCHILWAAFRSHDIMKTYIDSNFENHPVVSAEYVKFLATNSGTEKVEKLEQQVVGMTDKLSKAVEEAKKAVAKSDTASTKCTELGRELAVLIKKVKALEDKR
jgi:hypothetical protein